jgi:lysophospholipase L1-like esterase
LKKITFLLALTGALLMAGCSLFAPEEFTLDPPAVDSGTADFSNFVAIGNSLSAGYQSGALYESTQQYGFVQQLADAMAVSSFEVPWIADPGIYSAEHHLGHLQVVFDDEGNSGLAPIPWSDDIVDPAQLLMNATYVGPYHNLGVPGSTAYDMLFATEQDSCFTALMGSPNAYFDMILRNANFDWTLFGAATADLAVVDQAKLADPTFVSVWTGNNEHLMPAMAGMGSNFYPAYDDGGPLNFEDLYTGILGGLVQDLPNAKFVTADLPYVTSAPYFTTVPWFVIDPDQNPVDGDPYTDGIQLVGLLSEDVGQLSNGDFVCLTLLSYDSEPNGVPDQKEGLGIPAPILIGLLMSQGYTQEEAEAIWPTAFPHGNEALPGGLTLVASEADFLHDSIDEYNTVIHTVAGGLGVPVVEINDFFEEMATDGGYFNGVHYTLDFVTGGLFSLDGVHPSNIGHALTTEMFINTINEAYGSNLTAPTMPTVPMRAPVIEGVPALPAIFPGMPF